MEGGLLSSNPETSLNDQSSVTNSHLQKDTEQAQRIGDFIVDIEQITKASLILMRRFLPKKEYRLLKNRKCARICRKKRKEKAVSISEHCKILSRENKKLQASLQKVNAQLSAYQKEQLTGNNFTSKISLKSVPLSEEVIEASESSFDLSDSSSDDDDLGEMLD